MGRVGRLSYSGAPAAVAAGGAVPFNAQVLPCGMSYSGGALSLRQPGTYRLSASVTTSAAAAGTEAIQLYEGEVPVAGAYAAQAAAAEGDASNLCIEWVFDVRHAQSGTATLSIRSANATNIAHAMMVVERV